MELLLLYDTAKRKMPYFSRSTCNGIFNNGCYKVAAASDGETIMKISQHFTRLQSRVCIVAPLLFHSGQIVGVTLCTLTLDMIYKNQLTLFDEK